MKLFRNYEIKKIGILYLFFIIIGCFYFYFMEMPSVMLHWCAAIFISFIALYAYLAKRERDIEDMALKLDKILHGDISINFGDYSEGELSVLKSEIDKVIVKLREQADELQAEKVYMTDSIADISHQLRTPLTSINLIIDFLKKEGLSYEERMVFASDLQKLANRIDWLINALLKISKIDAKTVKFKQEKVMVKDLIEKSIAPIGIAMDIKNQTVDIVQQGTEFYTGDLAWSVEAIGNILKNCWEHTPEGGNIKIVCQQTLIFTQIEIMDNGQGIPLEDLPYMFQRFYKGKNSSSQSVGIGLALARMIIINQNGAIKAENLPSGGAKFTIKFYHTVV